MDRTEQQFYQELALTPELPDIFMGVQKKIRTQRRIEKTVLSLITIVLIAVGSIYISEKTNSIAIGNDPEIADELQIVRDFFDGSDIKDHPLDMYADAYIDSESF